MERGELPTARGVALTAEDRLRGEIIEQLMCAFHVDLAEVAGGHGMPVEVLAGADASLTALERDGLIIRIGPKVTVTPMGRVYVWAVCAAFDSYLEPAATRHALAV